MHIFHKLLNLFVLQIVYTVADRASITVRQIPVNETKAAGANVSIYCTYPIFAQNAAVAVYWWKGGQEGYIDPTADRRISIITTEQGSAEFHIFDVRFGDSGIFYCGVRDWTGKISKGNGTNVIVHESRHQFIFILTGALAACGVIILALLLLIRRFRVDRTEVAAENDENLSRYQENQASESQDIGSPSYADLNFRRDNKNKKVRYEAERTNALIIQGTEDKLMYACVDVAASQKNARRVQKTHGTEYAGIKIKEEARHLETKRAPYSH
ncbi:uncharacterized protein LOC134356411 isoform X2 [Mobula hypostoma]|uniref:uncharacterized protein LOC134356411 isoform X2 n=1 Tax=Mobula hypostoma TaxID=723540 RepID=UPI002FC2B8F5